LERHINGKFILHYEDGKDANAKYFCDTYIKEIRIIGHYVRKLQLIRDKKTGDIVGVGLQSLPGGQ
jgi:hypothetical protein